MKYFTPDLIVRMNSQDMSIVMKALEEWEERLAAYKTHLASVWKRLPRSVQRFLKTTQLHDAVLTGVHRWTRPVTRKTARSRHAGNARELWLMARIRDQLFTLHYALLAEPRIRPSGLPKMLCSREPSWLYDEFDVVDAGSFRHEILLSDGECITLRFSQFDLSQSEWLLPHKVKAVG